MQKPRFRMGGLACLGLLSCAHLLPAPAPVPTIWKAAPTGQARCLVVFLPGALDRASTFQNEGFFDLVRDAGLSVDAVAANATLGYYVKGRLVTRLEDDVVGPARKRGYSQVWLVGASMGGMGSLLFSRQRFGEVTGALLIAPFLGDAPVVDELYRAGGLAAWSPPPAVPVMTQENYQREIWRWLQAVTGGREAGPRLYLGVGDEDRLRRADALLAARLPPDHVFRTEGGHNWKAWHRLFEQFLARSEFARDCR